MRFECGSRGVAAAARPALLTQRGGRSQRLLLRWAQAWCGRAAQLSRRPRPCGCPERRQRERHPPRRRLPGPPAPLRAETPTLFPSSAPDVPLCYPPPPLYGRKRKPCTARTELRRVKRASETCSCAVPEHVCFLRQHAGERLLLLSDVSAPVDVATAAGQELEALLAVGPVSLGGALRSAWRPPSGEGS